jgi:hypothetical protein
MAHFAQVSDNGSITAVVVVDDKDCGGGEFPESEPIGAEFLDSIGLSGRWVQTSYNRAFRKWFATDGMIYDDDLDAFYIQSPGDGWTLDPNTCQWVSRQGSRLPI